jgi:predicted Zn-dependent peptidase
METIIFENGFRLIYEKPKNEIPIACIFGFVKVGSIYEREGIHGASHFVEHMCFKGTKKNPNNQSIIKYYDKIGAYLNAYTEKEYTCYQIKCQEEYLEHSIQLLSDMMLNSTFKKTHFIKEQNVVLEENIKNEDNMENIISNEIEHLLYEGSSYENPVDCLSYHKSKYQYDDILDLYNNYYHPSNMVLSIVSNVPISKIKRMIKSSFFLIKKPISNSVVPCFFLEPQSSVKYHFHKKSISATYLYISFRTCHHQSPDKYLLYFLSKIIGGTFSSRLFTILRENNGLTYECSSSTNYYSHSGDLSIFSILDPKKLIKNGEKKGVIPLIIELLNDVCINGIKKEEFEIIKGYIKGSLIQDMEDSNNICQYNGKQILLYGDKFTPYSEIFETHYQSIQLSQINKIIKKYFKKSNMSLCLLGSKLPSLDRIKKEIERFSF